MLSLSDTHCHLDFQAFDEDIADVLGRARETGVTRMLVPGVDIESSRLAIGIAKDHPEVFASVGVHPNYAHNWSEDAIDQLREMAEEPEVVAIGEIGLDFYRMRAEIDLQERIFREQLALAGELGLPVVIHNREATRSVMNLLTEWHSNLVEFGSDLAERAGVLHSYSEGLGTARIARRLNLLIGITGPVTFKKANELREVVAAIPLDQLLIETDSPYLSPEPHRGRRNEPAHVRFVAEKIAELHGTSLEAVSAQTSDNAKQLFLW
ncbi:MAG: TatD family hydrolase [Anaerolineales bacterium]|nr:TatD family hydrolase [Anaerolineales bacterium]